MERKFRYILLATMVALTVGSLLLIPEININEDMTQYLPDGSRMKEGVDVLRQTFTEMDLSSSVARNDIMPDNIGTILVTGVVIVFGILFLMCSSIVEALLFILTIGMAVMLNMGTNAFLPSVSMLTNTIVAVLQLVLSMDYSIILMNRFRQVQAVEPDIDKAMRLALRSASPSILSSGMTTIAGLLALVFMKFKIGMDLGVVLAKGVLFSLISIYTILPALIIIFHRGIQRTGKKVYLLPTDRLARFEIRARVPLAILFVAMFGASWYFSRQTELSYASVFEPSDGEAAVQQQNLFSLLYRTSFEDATIALTDSLAADPKVMMAISYPSLFRKQLTAEEMCGNISSLLSLLPEIPGADVPDIPIDTAMLSPETLRVLYYAATHPERDEKMSFEDMIQLASEVSDAGLLPEGMDVEAMISGFMAPEEEVVVPATKPESVNKAAPKISVAPAEEVLQAETVEEKEEKHQEVSSSLAEIAKPTVDESGDDPYELRGKYSFTKEMLHTPMTSTELAEYLGFSRGQASAAYTMAKKKNGTMTPDEFIDYMIDKVLGNRLLRTMISDKQAEGLHYIREEMDVVLAAADVPETVVDSVAAMAAIPEIQETPTAETPSVPVSEPTPEPTAEPIYLTVPEFTPMERLAEMYASGRKYSSTQIYSALHRAGIEVIGPEMIDLMFMYYGSRNCYADSTRMSLDEMIGFVSDEVAESEALAAFLDDSTRTMLGGLRGMVDEGMGMLRKGDWSMAAVVTEYPLEAPETFDFVEGTIAACTKALGTDGFYLLGESVMYKEMKDGFRQELVFLTLLTILLIFTIVALTFRSVLIPAILVMTVMTGVFANVFFSGLGGHTMLYLAYLIVQSILMGATIDYGILYTNYYLGFRRDGLSVADSVRNAYRGSIHTIMTSGLIIICAPFIMSRLLTEPTICSILSSLTFGAICAISLILLVLPALLAACDRLLTISSKHPGK